MIEENDLQIGITNMLHTVMRTDLFMIAISTVFVFCDKIFYIYWDFIYTFKFGEKKHNLQIFEI